MARAKKTEEVRKTRPPLTPEARESQLISFALDEVEKRIRDGTASSQVLTHFLKLASRNEQLKNERLEEENKMLRAKTKALEASVDSGERYEAALRAFREYRGQAGQEYYEDDENLQ